MPRFRWHSGHGRTCYWLDPVAVDPFETSVPSYNGRKTAPLIQPKVTPVIATDKRLGANELLMIQLGERIVEVAPGRGAEIDGALSAEIVRDWASYDIEGRSTTSGNGFDEVTLVH